MNSLEILDMNGGKLSGRRIAVAYLLATLLLPPLPCLAKEYPKDPIPPPSVRSLLDQNGDAQAVWWTGHGEAGADQDTFATGRWTYEFPEQYWWESFHDPNLTSVITTVLDQNPTMERSSLAVEMARQQARVSLGQELPQVSVGGSFARQHNSKNLTTPDLQQFQGAAPRLFAPGQTVNIYQAPLEASYELDLWGKNRNKTQGWNAQTEVQEWNLRATMVALAAEAASAYFNVAQAEALVEQQTALNGVWADTVQLYRARINAGLLDERTLTEAQASLTQGEALLAQYQGQLNTFRYQLAYLMGNSPAEAESIPVTALNEIEFPQAVWAGEPTALLGRRPDIRQAEARLKAAHYDVKVARKELLPTLSLSGQFGFASTKLSNWFDWDSYLASVAASLAQQLFTGGQRRAQLKLVKFQYDDTLAVYHDVVLRSFREVADHVSQVQNHRRELYSSAQSTALLQERVAMERSRYDAGLVNAIAVNQVQVSHIQQHKQQIQSKTQNLVDVVGLYKVLGGGF